MKYYKKFKTEAEANEFCFWKNGTERSCAFPMEHDGFWYVEFKKVKSPEEVAAMLQGWVLYALCGIGVGSVVGLVWWLW